MQPNLKTFPANLLKFDAYLKVVDSLDAAIKIIKDKRLAYGQPAIVTYKGAAPDKEDKSKKSSKSSKSSDGTFKHVLMGVGSMDPNNPYIIGIQYDKDGNPINQEELNIEIMKIIDEFKDKGFTITSLKYSKTEPSNINDTDFTYGDVILGEAAVKQVLNTVKPESKDLVTSKGIYDFITGLLQAITDTVNSLTETVTTLQTDVSSCKSGLVTIGKDVSTLKTEVSKIKVTQEELVSDVSALKGLVSVMDVSRIDASINDLYVKVGDAVNDVSIINNVKFIQVGYKQAVTDASISNIYVKISDLENDVSALKERQDIDGIESVISDSPLIVTTTRRHIVKIGIDVDEGFSNSFMEGDDGKIYLAWDIWNK